MRTEIAVIGKMTLMKYVFILLLIFMPIFKGFRITKEVSSSYYKRMNPLNSILEIKYGPDSFGDIMGGGIATQSVCCETNNFFDGNFTALERIVLACNGNLQLVMSAYYCQPVNVRVEKCIETSHQIYEREVSLLSKDKIELLVDKDHDISVAISNGRIGLGQLFRYIGKLPSFRLTTAAHNSLGQLVREYILEVPELKCYFCETFTIGFLDSNFLS